MGRKINDRSGRARPTRGKYESQKTGTAHRQRRRRNHTPKLPRFAPTGFWLLKSEPKVYSIDDLKRDGFTGWEGVRNFQARNYMRDHMKIGDMALFYHSNTKTPGITGICRIIQIKVPDPTAFNHLSKYYDLKSKPENPRWFMVEVEYVDKFPRLVQLDELKQYPLFRTMQLLKKGNRLSIMSVSEEQYNFIRDLGHKKID